MTELRNSILLFLILLSAGCAAQTEDFRVISNAELVEILASEEVQLIDVRTPEEWSFGTLEGAQKIDFYDPTFTDKINALDKSKLVVVYCAAGGRSAKASNKFRGLGFKKVYDLGGGFRSWDSEGLPIVKQ